MLAIPKRYYWWAGGWVMLWLFFSITAWQQLPWPVFSSPDETANYAFAQQDRDTSKTIIVTSKPGAPRSVVNTGTQLVPASFVFFPHLLGFVGKVSGSLGMLMFGPMLAATAMLAWFATIRAVFASKIVAWASVLFLATFPTFWFYAGRGFWQNGVFTSMLILAIAATVWAWRVRYWGTAALAGLLWGATLAVRPSEISWLLPGLVVGVGLVWKVIPWKQVGIALLFGSVPVLCLFLFQWQTYQSPIAVGYRPGGIFEPAPIVQKLGTFQQVKNVFFPFGTQPKAAWENFQKYGVSPVSYAMLPALVGLLWLAWRAPRRGKEFLVTSAVAGAFLVLLYGNYRFIEYPAVREAVLDSSYLRYWLPLLLLAALGWGGSVAMLWQSRLGKKFAYVAFSCVIALNCSLLFFDNTVGLFRTLPRVRESQEISRWVVAHTPPEAVIIAGNRDKLIFPRRHVIGFNGTVPKQLDIASSIDTWPLYILLSNPSQVNLLDVALPNLKIGQMQTSPTGLVLVQLQAP